MTLVEQASPHRAEIAASWRRTALCGLDPSRAMNIRPAAEVNLDGRLARAAAPVMERLRTQIDGSRFAVMLVDAGARMLTTADGCRSLRGTLDAIGALPGMVWTEETTGTNALATPHETRKPLFVYGSEHYADALKDYSCYGAPIFDPLTGRFEGVLDIMSDRGAESALMRSVIDTAVEAIARGLRADGSASARALLAAFDTATRGSDAVVVALDDSVVLQSASASALLSAPDIAMLRDLAGEAPAGRPRRLRVSLHTGIDTTAELVRVADSTGILVTLHLDGRTRVPRTAKPACLTGETQRRVARLRADRASGVVVLGEPGTGRTSVVRSLTAGRRSCVVDAVSTDGATAETMLRDELGGGCHEVLVVENIHLLDARARAVLADAVQRRGVDVVATGTDPDPQILARFPHQVRLRPLRERRHELFDVIRSLQGRHERLRFDGASARALTAYSWPGNLAELRQLLDALEHRRGSVVTVVDLPPHIRRGASGKQLTPWQRASCDAIELALELMHGNKAHAADFLGISRSTLYHHLKEYGLLT